MKRGFQIPEFFAGYIGLTANEELISLLEKNESETLELYTSIPDDKLNYRYASNKWSIKEVMQHITDTERIMAYRALRLSRGDQTPLPGFEQDDYVNNLKIDHLCKNDIIEEWKTVRTSTILLFRNLDPLLLDYEGIASGNKVNVELVGRIIAGHTRHHLIILRERYLG